jgi:hypothetical protein
MTLRNTYWITSQYQVQVVWCRLCTFWWNVTEVTLNLKSDITTYYIINPLFSQFSNKTTRAGVNCSIDTWGEGQRRDNSSRVLLPMDSTIVFNVRGIKLSSHEICYFNSVMTLFTIPCFSFVLNVLRLVYFGWQNLMLVTKYSIEVLDTSL